MTEADWLAGDDPTPMLEFVRDKTSERKLRLLACAMCRALTPPGDDVWGGIISTGERFADGQADASEVEEARRAAYGSASRQVAVVVLLNRLAQHLLSVLTHDLNLSGERNELYSALLRDIIGNPFRPVAFDPAWRTSTVLALVNGIYEDRAFDRLPILADALEEAGCDNADLLAHCRSDGEHVRGCWAVDLVLGKE